MAGMVTAAFLYLVRLCREFICAFQVRAMCDVLVNYFPVRFASIYIKCPDGITGIFRTACVNVQTISRSRCSTRRRAWYFAPDARGDSVMVMRAESMDMRKLADSNRGNMAPGTLRKYAREMFAVVR